jgi:hypothetical protein
MCGALSSLFELCCYGVWQAARNVNVGSWDSTVGISNGEYIVVDLAIGV